VNTVTKTAVRAKAARTKAAKSAKAKTKKTLVIVESPAKAKTIEKYLGRNFVVRASMGHLRDLPKSQFGIDVENNFSPKYINIRGKGDLIRELKKEAKDATQVYLASDPDREGEAIAWHLAYILGLDDKNACRIVFNEITKPAIQAAIKTPQTINIDRVDAQQARRMLDRIVGYKLSPLLWRTVRKGLSAGRVQSVAVKLICDRENEINAFQEEEYWTVEVKLKKGSRVTFTADLVEVDGEKPVLTNEADTNKLIKYLQRASYQVQEVKARRRQRKPAPPFNTSSLQQDAARKLNFTSRKTMTLAQQLYEGVSLGRYGSMGLITYMRTDSTRVSDVALSEVRSYIGAEYGANYLPEKANLYTTNKNAQDAHEAIRPTKVELTPAEVEPFLSRDQLRLYTLIWQRFVACQMAPAVYDTQSVTIAAGKRCLCRANGSRLLFDGFTAVYIGVEGKKEKDVLLPELLEKDELKQEKVDGTQHFTEPPPRYNDASLVKLLEEKGIGRPSTYAPIIETVLARGYVQRREKHFEPLPLGYDVVKLLEAHFANIVDVSFTASMESELDEVAEGKLDKNALLGRFYTPFATLLDEAEKTIPDAEIKDEVTDVQCELCGRMMVKKHGRFGDFLACPGFPECRNTKAIVKETGLACPKCGATIVERNTRRGRTFFGCKNYPNCDFVTWDTPQAEPCRACGSLVLKHRYKNGRGINYCFNAACETRVDNPINKELERMEKRTAAKQSGAAEEKAAAKKPTTKKKSAGAKTAVKKTTAKKVTKKRTKEK